MKPRTLSALTLTLASALLCAEASAGTCTLSSVSSPYFGGYDTFSVAPLATTGSVTFNCVSTGGISISLSRGGASSFFSRRMTSGSWSLLYNLFTDATHTAVWGDGTGGTSLYTNGSPPSGSNVTVTIYGRIPALQNVGVGSYTDTITATINF